MVDINQVVTAHYPQARPGDEVLDYYLAKLVEDYQVNLDKLLFATSLCSDDINCSADLARALTHPFFLGGLAGVPFTGLTGLGAYAAHIPDGGDGMILYGPHIGITDEGELGKLLRPGQDHLTTDCGALVAALKCLEQNDTDEIAVDVQCDFQLGTLEQMLMPYRERVLGAESPMKEITDVAYEVINEQLSMLLDKSEKVLKNNRLFLLGGIFINTSEGEHDYIDVRSFRIASLGETPS